MENHDEVVQAFLERAFYLNYIGFYPIGIVIFIAYTYILTRDYQRARDIYDIQFSSAVKEYYPMKDVLEVKISKPSIDKKISKKVTEKRKKRIKKNNEFDPSLYSRI